MQEIDAELQEWNDGDKSALDRILSDWGLTPEKTNKMTHDSLLRVLATVHFMKKDWLDVQGSRTTLSNRGRRFFLILKKSLQIIKRALQFANLWWNLQRCLYWLGANWTLGILKHEHFTHRSRRMTAVFQTCFPTFELTQEQLQKTSVVYVKLNVAHRGFYIGSTSGAMFDREQTRNRNFHQLCSGHLVFTSQLSKLCYYSVVFYWSGHSGAKNRVAKTAKTKFELPILKKLNIQKQTYNLPQAGHDTIMGQRTLTRYTKLTQSTAFLTSQIQQQLPQLTEIYNLLYSLGSDSIQKFVVSRRLEVLDVTQPSIFCCGDCHGTSLNLFTQELNSKCVWLCAFTTRVPQQICQWEFPVLMILSNYKFVNGYWALLIFVDICSHHCTSPRRRLCMSKDVHGDKACSISRNGCNGGIQMTFCHVLVSNFQITYKIKAEICLTSLRGPLSAILIFRNCVCI